MIEVIEPRNFTSCADLEEYCRFPVSFQKNVIMYILIEVHILQLDPKVDELGEVIHGEVVTPC
jgi:hypothetical protein